MTISTIDEILVEESVLPSVPLMNTEREAEESAVPSGPQFLPSISRLMAAEADPPSAPEIKASVSLVKERKANSKVTAAMALLKPALSVSETAAE